MDEDFTFSQGRAFRDFSPENTYFEAVVGARVAKEMNVAVGETFYPTHGDPSGEGHAQGFTIVGIMNPTGTPSLEEMVPKTDVRGAATQTAQVDPGVAKALTRDYSELVKKFKK